MTVKMGLKNSINKTIWACCYFAFNFRAINSTDDRTMLPYLCSLFCFSIFLLHFKRIFNLKNFPNFPFPMCM